MFISQVEQMNAEDLVSAEKEMDWALVEPYLNYVRVRPARLLIALRDMESPKLKVASEYFAHAIVYNWGPGRAVATMLAALVLDSEEILHFDKLETLLRPLADLDYIKFGKRAHEIISASGTIMGTKLDMTTTARLSYVRILAARANWPPKLTEEDEAMARKETPVPRRAYDGDAWMEVAYRRRLELSNRMRLLQPTRKQPIDLDSHNGLRPITGPTGHSGGGLVADDFGLNGLKGLQPDSILSGKRKLHMLLKPIQEPFAHHQTSKRMKKVEAGILGRGLYPLSYETSLVSELLEKWSKIILEEDEYCQLEKSYEHTVAQRLRLWRKFIRGSILLCSDASAWDCQHSSQDMEMSLIRICDLAKKLRPEISQLAESLKEAACASQYDKRILIRDKLFAVVAGALFSGDGLTAHVNTEQILIELKKPLMTPYVISIVKMLFVTQFDHYHASSAGDVKNQS